MPTRLSLLVLFLGAMGLSPQRQDPPSEPILEGPVLEGHVMNDRGEPVEGVAVTLFGGLATRWKTGETTTNAEGFYRFDPVDAGTTGVQIEHPEYVSADGRWWWDVRVPARLDFHVRPAGYLLGLLLDEVGRPYSLPLRLQGVGHDNFRWTEAREGAIDERGLFPGVYEIQVNDGNLDYPVLGRVTVVAGEVATARLSFSREREESTPTLRPRTFAPEAISRPGVSRGSFSPDGRSFVFSKRTGAGPHAFSLHVSVKEFGLWGAPTRLDLGEGHGGHGSSPAISPDGRRLVFASHRGAGREGEAEPEPSERSSLWMSRKSSDGWGPPQPLEGIAPVSSELASSDLTTPVFGPGGRLHFLSTGPDGSVQALVSERDGETFSSAVVYEPIQRWLGRRGTRAVWSGVPSPDGSFVLLTVSEWLTEEGMPRAADLWVSLKTDEGWTEPRPVKGAVNTAATECFPCVFPDGRQLLFVRDFLTYERVSLERALDR